MKISPATAGFIKNIVMVIIFAVVAYLGDAVHLTGILSPSLALIVASLFSGLESKMKAKDDGKTALFGTLSVHKN